MENELMWEDFDDPEDQPAEEAIVLLRRLWRMIELTECDCAVCRELGAA